MITFKLQRKIKEYKKSQKGISLLWTMLIITLLLLIVATMVSIMVKEIRFSVNIDDAHRAYYAAEAGIEKGMKIVKEKAPEWFESPSASPGYQYSETLVIGTNLLFKLNIELTSRISSPDGDQFKGAKIESLGTSNDINRKVRTTFELPPNCIDDYSSDPDLRPSEATKGVGNKTWWRVHDIRNCKDSEGSPTSGSTGSKGYLQEFTFKPEIIGGGNKYLGIGLTDRDSEECCDKEFEKGSGTRQKLITTRIFSDKINVYVRNDDTDFEETVIDEALPFPLVIDNYYRIRLRYIPGVAVKLKIFKTNEITGNWECGWEKTGSLVGKNSGTFDMDKVFYEVPKIGSGNRTIRWTGEIATGGSEDIYMRVASNIAGFVDNMIVILDY